MCFTNSSTSPSRWDKTFAPLLRGAPFIALYAMSGIFARMREPLFLHANITSSFRPKRSEVEKPALLLLRARLQPCRKRWVLKRLQPLRYAFLVKGILFNSRKVHAE